ncbi:protein of unknown function [Burkholderia multivorans]
MKGGCAARLDAAFETQCRRRATSGGRHGRIAATCWISNCRGRMRRMRFFPASPRNPSKIPGKFGDSFFFSPFCRVFCKSGRAMARDAIVYLTGCARRAAPFCKRPRSSPLARSSIFFTLRGFYD